MEGTGKEKQGREKDVQHEGDSCVAAESTTKMMKEAKVENMNDIRNYFAIL